MALAKIIQKVVMAFWKRLHLSYYIILFSKNWLNPFLTLYINVAFLPINQAIKFPIWIYGKTKFLALTGEFIIDADKIHSGMIIIGKSNESPCFSGGGCEIINRSKIIFKGTAKIGCGCRILVYGGKLILGNNFIMNNQNLIGCSNYIEVGEMVVLGHQNQILDTDFHFIYNIKSRTAKNNSSPIIIGNHCWIGNRTSIMKGTAIPDYTIIGSNTLLNKNYSTPKGTVLAGIPAVSVAENYVAIWNQAVEGRLFQYFRSENSIYQFPQETELDDLVNI